MSMSRGKVFVICFVYLFLYAYFCMSIGIIDDMVGFATPKAFGSFKDFSILDIPVMLVSTFKTIFRLATFQISGLPTLLTVFTIYPPLFMVIFILVETIFQIFS